MVKKMLIRSLGLRRGYEKNCNVMVLVGRCWIDAGFRPGVAGLRAAEQNGKKKRWDCQNNIAGVSPFV